MIKRCCIIGCNRIANVVCDDGCFCFDCYNSVIKLEITENYVMG